MEAVRHQTAGQECVASMTWWYSVHPEASFSLPFSKFIYISTLYDSMVTSQSAKSRLGCCYPQHIANTAKGSSPAKRHQQTDGQGGKVLQQSKSRRSSLVLTCRLQNLLVLLSFKSVGFRKRGERREPAKSPSWHAAFGG